MCISKKDYRLETSINELYAAFKFEYPNIKIRLSKFTCCVLKNCLFKNLKKKHKFLF